jgi:hypothetical protein
MFTSKFLLLINDNIQLRSFITKIFERSANEKAYGLLKSKNQTIFKPFLSYIGFGEVLKIQNLIF